MIVTVTVDLSADKMALIEAICGDGVSMEYDAPIVAYVNNPAINADWMKIVGLVAPPIAAIFHRDPDIRTRLANAAHDAISDELKAIERGEGE